MTEMPFTATHSLWALSFEGILWQVNPISGLAAPLCPLQELSVSDCNILRHEILQRWRRYSNYKVVLGEGQRTDSEIISTTSNIVCLNR